MSILAIDFGGTRTRAACFSTDLKILTRRETPSLLHLPAEEVIQRIIKTAREVANNSEEPVHAIGISAPGPLDPKTGVIRHAKTLPGWHNVPLPEMISDAFNRVPAFIENDANLAALAEYQFGAGQGANPMLYLTISTGIGGGLVLGGKLFTGWSGLAIEPGHMCFTRSDGKICRLEELASGTALGHLAQEKLGTNAGASVLRGVSVVDGLAVGEAAMQGDSLALSVVREAGTALGIGLVNLLHLFRPQAIVIGGSVANLGDLLLEPARRAIEAYILDPAFYSPQVLRLSRLGDDVCLIGAALHTSLKL